MRPLTGSRNRSVHPLPRQPGSWRAPAGIGCFSQPEGEGAATGDQARIRPGPVAGTPVDPSRVDVRMRGAGAWGGPWTSCGTIQVYVAPAPCAKPRSLPGLNGVTHPRRRCAPGCSRWPRNRRWLRDRTRCPPAATFLEVRGLLVTSEQLGPAAERRVGHRVLPRLRRAERTRQNEPPPDGPAGARRLRWRAGTGTARAPHRSVRVPPAAPTTGSAAVPARGAPRPPARRPRSSPPAAAP